FRQPFFAVSCADLWRRWHMSLMSWFKDYLYIPLGGSRKGKIRQVINNLIVFTVSGLWHGAAFGYIIWGFLSGVFSVFGNFTKGLREGLMEKFPLKGGVFHSIHTAARMLITFICFNAALIFFKSPSIEVALEVAGKIFTGLSFSDIVSTSFFELGLGTINFIWLLVALSILLVVDIIKEKGMDVYTVVTSKPAFIRWGVYYALLIMIIFSTNIGAASFIYFKF
nr:MBOAT family protein [Lachnospiraceae bacterium]